MSTVEDVFYLYEHSSNSTNYDENQFQKILLPFTIGDQDTPCELKIKCYIKPGDECPICYDQILTKSSAYITNCGHHYHKKCIFNYMRLKWLSSSYYVSIKCPMCRCSLGHPEFIQRYRCSYFSYRYYQDNGLDKLEDFWLSNEYKLPEYCINQFDHYLGFSNDCETCSRYREKGVCVSKDPYL
jgi:hypothetical protein